jgi:N-acetylglucosamine-6-phosphate deacetylase
MSPFTHREPGVAGAVFDSSHVTAELICDGIHVHPAVVRMTFSLLGADRVIMISDSMRATGMPDGQYTLGGLDVTVHGKYATLTSDGVLAGSVTSLPDCVRTAVLQMEIPLETAIAAATVNPAKKLGILEDRGTLEAGKRADIVLWKEDLSLAAVIKDGRLQGQ